MVIIEGADGTGKTTLAKAIVKWTGGQYIHCSYNCDWDIEVYHRHVLHFAGKLEEQAKVPVVIDRWAISEDVYGSAYRDGPSYDTAQLHEEAVKAYSPKLIYCTNDYIVANHKKLQWARAEMYEDITPACTQYAASMISGKYSPYIRYDFNRTDITNFIKSQFKESI